jgi:hypothetical protein
MIRLTASFGETPAVAFMLIIRKFYMVGRGNLSR